MRQFIIAGISLAAICLSSPAGARVERIEILSRQAFAIALDPDAAANGPIADLKLAPRNDRSRSTARVE